MRWGVEKGDVLGWTPSGTIRENVIMDNHISRHGASLDLQAKEGMDNIKSRAVSKNFRDQV